TRAFFAQTFLAHTFYDALPLITIECEAARMLGITDVALWQELAALQADIDIQGVYRLLLRFASADKIVESMPKLGKRYFNFVDTSVAVHRPGYAELLVRGVPHPLTPAYKALAHAYLMRTLE